MYHQHTVHPFTELNSQRRLKRKEYQTSADFAADIELVFNNAFTFNQEHSAVWEDAVALRVSIHYAFCIIGFVFDPLMKQDYFRRLMSDLPTPFALPEYAKAPRTSNKIKLKVPGPNQASPTGQSSSVATTATATAAQPAASPSFTLRVPGGNEAIKTPVNNKVQQKSPNIAAAPAPAAPVAAPSTAYSNQLPHAPMTAQTYPIQPIQVTPRQPVTYQYTPQHYPNAAYQSTTHNLPATPSTSQVVTTAIPHIDAQSLTKSPSPSNHRPLKGVSLTTKPRGRPLKLDYRDGVKSWAMRLGRGESAVCVADVQFLGDDGEQQGSEDEAHDADKTEESAVDAEASPMGKVKRGRGRPPKGAGRGGAIAKAKDLRSAKAAQTKAATPLQDSIKLRLNGAVVAGKENSVGEWDVDLRLGSNVLEVGEEGGMTWKVYMERVSAV